MKKKPSCLELNAWLNAGLSLSDIHKRTGYSVTYLSTLAKNICGLEIPGPGRRKGFKMSEESKAKISESNKKGV